MSDKTTVKSKTTSLKFAWTCSTARITCLCSINSEFCHSQHHCMQLKWVGSHSFSRGNFSAFCCPPVPSFFALALPFFSCPRNPDSRFDDDKKCIFYASANPNSSFYYDAALEGFASPTSVLWASGESPHWTRVNCWKIIIFGQYGCFETRVFFTEL